MNSSKKIAIVDYGVGNLWSVLKAVRKFEPDAFVTEEKEKVDSADAIILPGVGTFKAGMDGLLVRDLVETIRLSARRRKPILGVCLGAQLLMEKGYEFGEHKGLGIIKGEVVKFPKLPENVKIPDIGWQEVFPSHNPKAQKLFTGLEHPFFYFAHSYILIPKQTEVSLGKTIYGGYGYCAVIGDGNTYGTQFHPEKSGNDGLRLIKNFITSI